MKVGYIKFVKCRQVRHSMHRQSMTSQRSRKLELIMLFCSVTILLILLRLCPLCLCVVQFLFIAHSTEKLLGDIGLEMICHYLSFGFYPHLNEINLQDNLLTDTSLNCLSDLIESRVCPELRFLNLCCNYISQSMGQTFLDYCSQHSVSIEIGGCPDFALSSAVPRTHSPTLLFRAVARNGGENVSVDTLVYSDFYRMGQWCHVGGKPFVGIQLFYYGCGQITARLVDANGNYSFGDGECGNLILTTHLLPIVSVEFGCRDVPFYVTGFTDTTDGYLTSLKICFVAHYSVCLKSRHLLTFFFCNGIYRFRTIKYPPVCG